MSTLSGSLEASSLRAQRTNLSGQEWDESGWGNKYPISRHAQTDGQAPSPENKGLSETGVARRKCLAAHRFASDCPGCRATSSWRLVSYGAGNMAESAASLAGFRPSIGRFSRIGSTKGLKSRDRWSKFRWLTRIRFADRIRPGKNTCSRTQKVLATTKPLRFDTFA